MAKRNFGIDLLKIISMFMIVNLHVIGHGGLAGGTQQVTGEFVVVWTWETIMYCSVNCYAIVSGLVGYGRDRKWGGAINLWIQTFFYSVTIPAVLLLTGVYDGGLRSIVKCLFPLSTERYWYFTAYIGMLIFAPLLNRVVDTMEKKELRNALVIITLVLGLPTTIFYSDPFHIEYGCSALWLMVMYLIGAYIKKYGTADIPKRKFLIGFWVTIIINCAAKFSVQFVATRLGIALSNSYLNANVVPTIVIAAICLVCYFRDVEIKSSFAQKLCVGGSALTYGVFLFHVHPFMINATLLDKFLWILDRPTWAIIPIVIGCSVIIFAVSLMVEWIRKTVFRLLRVDKFGPFAERLCQRLYDTAEKKLEK
ncbi:MAG: acyltransferase [Clostridia bacterium]|nr:acyltransferase [Clostridia bacterium]